MIRRKKQPTERIKTAKTEEEEKQNSRKFDDLLITFRSRAELRRSRKERKKLHNMCINAI